MGFKELLGGPQVAEHPGCETCRAACCVCTEFFNLPASDIRTLAEGNFLIVCETREEYEETIRQNDKTHGVFVVWGNRGKLMGRCGNLVGNACGVNDHKPRACEAYPVNGDGCRKAYRRR